MMDLEDIMLSQITQKRTKILSFHSHVEYKKTKQPSKMKTHDTSCFMVLCIVFFYLMIILYMTWSQSLFLFMFKWDGVFKNLRRGTLVSSFSNFTVVELSLSNMKYSNIWSTICDLPSLFSSFNFIWIFSFTWSYCLHPAQFTSYSQKILLETDLCLTREL